MNYNKREKVVNNGTFVAVVSIHNVGYKVVAYRGAHYLVSPVGSVHEAMSFFDGRATVRSDVILETEVEPGEMYRRGKMTVEIVSDHQLGGWWARNLVTGRDCWIQKADELSACLTCAYPKVTANLISL